VLKIFLFSYFEYCKNWLHIFIDGHHLNNMEILKRKTPNMIVMMK
jgi:hypothetical protein